MVSSQRRATERAAGRRPSLVPLSSAAVKGTTSLRSVTVSGAGPFLYTVTINWVERISNAKNTTTGGGTVTGGGATETFTYTIRRMYQNRLLIV